MREERYKTHFRGGIFHVYNRGTDGRRIFLDKDDFWTYLERFGVALKAFGITSLAYCLMPNHVHLLLRQDTEEPIARLVSSLHTSYVKRFNIKHRRTGHLFQSRFRQSVVRKDVHLRHLVAYIHLNPVEAGLSRRSEDYRWNSHRAYAGEDPAAPCAAAEGLDLFTGIDGYRKFLADTLARPRTRRWRSVASLTLE